MNKQERLEDLQGELHQAEKDLEEARIDEEDAAGVVSGKEQEVEELKGRIEEVEAEEDDDHGEEVHL